MTRRREAAAGGRVVSTPAHISGLSFWLDAALAGSYADTNPVTAWADVSGNARHFINDVDAGYPLFRTAQKNGKPAIVFDGVNDWLYRNPTGVSSAEFTLMLTFKLNAFGAAASKKGLISWSAAPSHNDYDSVNGGAVMAEATGTLLSFFRATGADTANPFILLNTTEWHCWVLRIKGTAATFWKDGVQVASDTATALTMAPTSITLGARRYVGVPGDWASYSLLEAAFWPTGIADADLIALSLAQKTKYAIT
jgi:hypothetical protein